MQQDIVNWKTALQTTDTPAQANLTPCKLASKTELSGIVAVEVFTCHMHFLSSNQPTNQSTELKYSPTEWVKKYNQNF